MKEINVKIINKSNYPNPCYQTDGSAGMDLHANNESNIWIHSLGRVLVETGIYLEIPTGFEAQIRPRSGLANKFGVTLLNSPATIDSDYRGEVKVLLVNLSEISFLLEPGMRIAQIVFSPVTKAILLETNQLDSSDRGEGGFGHTGL